MSEPLSPMSDTEVARRDADHLKLLSIFHYIFGGLICLMSFFFLVYAVMGAAFMSPEIMDGGSEEMSADETAVVGGIFIAIGIGGFVLCMLVGILTVVTGRKLQTRRHSTFCFVMSGLHCLNMPIGTALGVCTILVLQRSSVQALFAGGIRRDSP